jgi:aminoglycoside phosphotransferase family enzyme
VLIERLLDPAAYPHPTFGIRLVETHISWVILTGPFAYKLKKPVSLGFVDYSSLELRRRSCEGEVRVSGRFAPELYVAAVPITGSAEAPRMGGRR